MPDLGLLDPSRGEVPAPSAPERRVQPPTAVLVCLAAAVTCSGVILLIFQSHLTFFVDDWAFLLDRRGSSAAVFLDPYNNHIVLAPVAIYKGLLALFGMSSAMPFQIVSTLVFLLSVVLLFLYLSRRVGGWLALLGSVLILFLGAAWNDLLFSFQIVFFGSAAAGIGALLALDGDDRKGDPIACALLVVATSFSELGIPFVVAALVSLVLGPAPRLRRLYVPLLPLALYGIWYLGWGHTGSHPESFHNLVHSPKFVFDSISQNLASLFGLATPLNGQTGPNVGGLNWGRVLFVIAIALAIWRLRRVGWPSRWLWAVLAGGAALWLITALAADPLKRTPSTGRYQYQGAIFVLLIAAEFLRGVRPAKRVLAAATAVTIAAAISGYIFLHDGYNRRKYASDLDRAKLAAVEIGRGHVSPTFVINLTTGTAPIYAGSYFSAVDAFGSPAFSESQLAASDEADRAAADQLLAPAEGIRLGPLAPAIRRGQVGIRCQSSIAAQPGSTAPALGPGKYMLRARKQPGTAGNVGVPVEVARFADAPSVSLGFVNPGTAAALRVPRDKSSRPWRPASTQAVTICQLGSAAKAQHTTPNLVGQRLDVAERRLQQLGISFKAVGGGGQVLPIVVTKNWTVCRTMPGAGARSKGPVALVVNRPGPC
jgi:hypothetical protein